MFLPARPTLATWVAWVSLGEFLGFLVPATTAVLADGSGRGWMFVLMVIAGAAEGLVLGLAQARVLSRSLGVATAPWAAATSVGAAFAWSVGMLPSTFESAWVDWRPASAVLAAVGMAAVLLLSIGTAQWVVLRRHIAAARAWIVVTALAWCAGLAAFTAVTTPLWQPGQPRLLVALVGVVGGAPMAVVMATVTGSWLRRRSVL